MTVACPALTPAYRPELCPQVVRRQTSRRIAQTANVHGGQRCLPSRCGAGPQGEAVQYVRLLVRAPAEASAGRLLRWSAGFQPRATKVCAGRLWRGAGRPRSGKGAGRSTAPLERGLPAPRHEGVRRPVLARGGTPALRPRRRAFDCSGRLLRWSAGFQPRATKVCAGRSWRGAGRPRSGRGAARSIVPAEMWVKGRPKSRGYYGFAAKGRKRPSRPRVRGRQITRATRSFCALRV